jgi:hypothetical protein
MMRSQAPEYPKRSAAPRGDGALTGQISGHNEGRRGHRRRLLEPGLLQLAAGSANVGVRPIC